jgi:glutamate synthase domain-containing protein 1
MKYPNSKDISGCGVFGVMSESGRRFSGEMALRAIANMRERCNGLGGGFAGYGIYPEHKDCYALHLMCDDHSARRAAEAAISRRCDIRAEEPIPTRSVVAIRNRPVLHRYFVSVKARELEPESGLTEDDVIVDVVMKVSAQAGGAFIFSSGRNMGIFKGVGYAEDIGAFFRLEEYEACIWTAHGRFPTNTPGWWGGAHPFALLDWTVIHNGEISSYGINKRYLENFGYRCLFQTDTEVITYLFDLLVRKHRLPIEAACLAMAPPFWAQIERMSEDRQRLAKTLRIVYGGALLNGPFSVIVGHSGGMIGLTDRTKLRPMVAARKGDLLFISSEEGAVREVCADPELVWHAIGGVPIVGRLKSALVAGHGSAAAEARSAAG